MWKYVFLCVAAVAMSMPSDAMGARMEKATFGAGCFWHVEEAFRQVKGVVSTRVGYMGGKTDNPAYRDVCSHTTGHAEVVEVTFDPSKVTYEKLLDTFWDEHDPTSVNRQGPDVGDQYRSAIFYHSEDQRKKAMASIAALEKSGKYKRPTATELVPVTTFWMAEEYHQQYLEKHGMSSCGVR